MTRTLIVLPVLNEEAVLRDSVLAVRDAASRYLPGHESTVLIVDNGSDDRTPEVADGLMMAFGDVDYLRLERRGKGLAIREGWMSSDADVYVFMDADLSTGLEALPSLVDAVRDGGGMATGSRYLPGSTVERSLLRRLLSHGYRFWLRTVLSTGCGDAPCGFKAASPAVVRDVMPFVEDDGWFFDSELLVRTERTGLPVREVPVRWSDAKDRTRPSKVAVFRLAGDYMRKTLALRRRLNDRPV